MVWHSSPSFTLINFYLLWAVHTICPQSGVRSLSSADKGGGFVLQMRTSAAFLGNKSASPHRKAQKTSDFSKFMVSARTRGKGRLSQCKHFADKGEGVNFSRFCADVSYERPLTANIRRHWRRSQS